MSGFFILNYIQFVVFLGINSNFSYLLVVIFVL